MICILHGYLLEGSGSNLWTREMVRALCREGEAVHLVCQEPHPEHYDFIAAAYAYEPDGGVTTLFERKTPYEGRCVLHKPRLGDTLPVYVGDKYEEFARALPMIDLPDAAIEDYLGRNVVVVERVVREAGVSVLHANHAVLMSVVAERVHAATGVPYAVMPHGSAIEYAVKKDPRFHALAESALAAADRLIVIGEEMRRRVRETFPALPGLEKKLRDLPLGVDTAAFAPVGREDRGARLRTLEKALAGLERGRRPEAAERLRASLRPDMARGELVAALQAVRGYEWKRPDAGLEQSLARIDWRRDELLLYVGRLIAAKGPQSIVAALPLILSKHPRARLVVVGHGPLREVLEALLWALEEGAAGLARAIADWGSVLEGRPAPFEHLRLFFSGLEERGELDGYFEAARRTVRSERVIFTGYLTHGELKHLFPCCDAAVFPSVVAEAGPLVFLEALASGSFPLGTYFAGMAASIDAVAGALPPEHADLMKLSIDPARKVAEIAEKTAGAFDLGGRHKQALRDVVAARHDWRTVARRLAAELADLGR
ncbi:MAG: glycosyltransferase [Rhodospirillales bacterium]|nr:glycosyltransferase [Rhodospirillales bacterium]MDH3910006.1 glycosyltransferase [Rhodospirillales bacterium]MDH3916712.1 glycosyltransferase [Rhodospirillales bacterium]MDH3965514.1 glycosyltransferase [Rhodospirillales bacterium]